MPATQHAAAVSTRAQGKYFDAVLMRAWEKCEGARVFVVVGCDKVMTLGAAWKGERAFGRHLGDCVCIGRISLVHNIEYLTLKNISACTGPRMSLGCVWHWETLVSKMAWAMAESELGYVKGRRDINCCGCNYNY